MILQFKTIQERYRRLLQGLPPLDKKVYFAGENLLWYRSHQGGYLV